ncbi:uncharacterized protein LOC132339361 [Haemorhous mexicanus]|uniref:uncharacterized protein LOC132339361 n=1 Tax=Haemorhous mexicanus TaxID=30427 RepID=UPI0028BE0449|nr:uncharacterized protein LOC132339361 [Haemorhous mexicanus]
MGGSGDKRERRRGRRRRLRRPAAALAGGSPRRLIRGGGPAARPAGVGCAADAGLPARWPLGARPSSLQRPAHGTDRVPQPGGSARWCRREQARQALPGGAGRSSPRGDPAGPRPHRWPEGSSGTPQAPVHGGGPAAARIQARARVRLAPRLPRRGCPHPTGQSPVSQRSLLKYIIMTKVLQYIFQIKEKGCCSGVMVSCWAKTVSSFLEVEIQGLPEDTLSALTQVICQPQMLSCHQKRWRVLHMADSCSYCSQERHPDLTRRIEGDEICTQKQPEACPLHLMGEDHPHCTDVQ